MKLNNKILKIINEDALGALSFDDEEFEDSDMDLQKIGYDSVVAASNKKLLINDNLLLEFCEGLYTIGVLSDNNYLNKSILISDNAIWYKSWADMNYRKAISFDYINDTVYITVYRTPYLLGVTRIDLAYVIIAYNMTAVGKARHKYVINSICNKGIIIPMNAMWIGADVLSYAPGGYLNYLMPEDIVAYNIDEKEKLPKDLVNALIYTNVDDKDLEAVEMIANYYKSYGYEHIACNLPDVYSGQLTQFDLPDLELFIVDNKILFTQKDIDRVNQYVHDPYMSNFGVNGIMKMLGKISFGVNALQSRNKLLARFAIYMYNMRLPFLAVPTDMGDKRLYDALNTFVYPFNYGDTTYKGYEMCPKFIIRYAQLAKQSQLFNDLTFEEIMTLFKYAYAYYLKYGNKTVELTKRNLK